MVLATDKKVLVEFELLISFNTESSAECQLQIRVGNATCPTQFNVYTGMCAPSVGKKTSNSCRSISPKGR
jgi:hypothetical protein